MKENVRKKTGRKPGVPGERCRDALVSIHLPPGLKDKLRITAARSRLTMSKFATIAVIEKMERTDQDKLIAI